MGILKLTVRSMDKTLMDLAKYPDLQGIARNGKRGCHYKSFFLKELDYLSLWAITYQ